MFAGKALGEISNVLSEASSFLEQLKRQSAAEGTGVAGEILFAVGGGALAVAARRRFLDRYNSAPTLSPEQRKELAKDAVDFLKGLANIVSGVTGVIGDLPRTDPIFVQISSAAWAASEGANLVMQGYEGLQKGRTLDKEQWVHIGQIVGSALKFGGIVATLKDVSGNAPIIAEAAGSGASIASGILNLNNKRYIEWFIGAAKNLIPSQILQQAQATELRPIGNANV